MADTLKCPRCGNELKHHYTRQVNFYCDCGYNFKEHQFEICVLDWQVKALKAESEVTRLTAELEAVNKRVDGLSVEVIEDMICNILGLKCGSDYVEQGWSDIRVNDIAKAIQSKPKAVK